MRKERISYGEQADMSMRTWIEISRAFIAIRHKETEYFESKGLTMHQFAVMEALYHVGPLSIGELTKLILSTPGSMTVIIKNLKKKGYIEPNQQEADKRKIILKLTETGQKLIADVFPKHAENMAGYFSRLNADEQKTLQELMRKLSKANRSI
ncbi:MAG: MarR family winged helix-turn-helix transcriptional regulator [Deferribacterales bacterium]